MPRSLCVVLPCFNEEVALGRLLPQFEALREFLEESLSIIVVDDGSRDRTAEVAREWKGATAVTLVSLPSNQGYGAALETGIAHCAGKLSPADLIVTMDADDTHSPLYIRDLIAAANMRNLDVVIASRYAQGGLEHGVSWDRRLLSHGASWFYRRAFDLPQVSDYSCGYRLFKAGLIQNALTDRGGKLGLGNGFQATGELLLCLREQTEAIGETPFELHYERKPTASKMPKLQTIYGTFCFLWKVRSRLARMKRR